MTTWNELRTVALVGTERRALPSFRQASQVPELPDGLSAEQQALHVAALLGVARRTATTRGQGEPPAEPVSVPPIENVAPKAAVQLLELLVNGNAGPGSMATSLFDQWFALCTRGGYVLPHRLLVAVLDKASATSELRPLVRDSLGHRGRWLGTQRSKWKWAATLEPEEHAIQTQPGSDVDLETLLLMSPDERDQSITAARQRDTTAGRRLIIDACEQLDAASRSRVLGCLGEGLGADDEELLEGALDDRSKLVRASAISLLNQLTTSARADRMTRRLEPLVSTSGRKRFTIKVAYPQPPEDDQLRDLPPDGRGVIEQQWFDAIIAATPLTWWEDTLDLSPAKIVNAQLSNPTELPKAWSLAAIAQQNTEWLEALFERTREPNLLAYISPDAAAQAFLTAVRNDVADNKTIMLLAYAPGPWDVGFSEEVLDWAQASSGKTRNNRLNMASGLLAENLAVEVQPELESWLESKRTDADHQTPRVLRNLIQQLSFRTSINEAFNEQ